MTPQIRTTGSDGTGETLSASLSQETLAVVFVFCLDFVVFYEE